MENLIYIDSTTISPAALMICGAAIVLISYLLALLKDHLPGGNRTLYP